MKDEDNLFSSTVVDINETVDLPSMPTKEGHMFRGWFLEGEAFDSQKPITKHLKIYAKWEKCMYTIDFTTYSDSVIEPIQVLYGDKIEEPIQPVKEGYDFIGWSRYGIKYDFNQPVTSNITLAAEWEMKKEALNNYLSNLVPNIVTTNLNLIESLRFCSATFIWSSSNKKALTDTGIVKRFATDTNLELTVQILYSDKEYSLSFNILVPGLNLKPLIKGQIVSGYLYDYGGFSGLSDKALEQLDYINYSFATISNGEVNISSNMKVEKVLEYRNKGIRIGLAIGGWEAGGFSPAMKTQEGRTKLINSIMKLIDEYQFDGIDIDWEYPTSSVAGIESDPSDRTNLTLFCQELKERMKEYRDDLILSIAITASTRYYDLAALNNYVDFFNVMTYDFAMGTKAQHNSALYTTIASPSSLDASVGLVSKYVDNDKIIPGAAFYIRKGTFSNGVSQQLGSSLKTSMGSGSMTFANLMNLIKNNDQYTEQYDENAKAAYIICDNVFYSYDNVQSIKDKCQYVKDNNLAGLMCWELTQDYIDDNGVAILVNAMYESLK
ncbi:MAG: glycosyl hydrolase family 18 protein [Bacilli bacterium]